MVGRNDARVHIRAVGKPHVFEPLERRDLRPADEVAASPVTVERAGDEIPEADSSVAHLARHHQPLEHAVVVDLHQRNAVSREVCRCSVGVHGKEKEVFRRTGERAGVDLVSVNLEGALIHLHRVPGRVLLPRDAVRIAVAETGVGLRRRRELAATAAVGTIDAEHVVVL